MRYKLLPDSEINSHERKLAQAAVVETCRVLKIATTPAIKFFREATEFEDNFRAFELTFHGAHGFTDGQQIFLRRNLPEMRFNPNRSSRNTTYMATPIARMVKPK